MPVVRALLLSIAAHLLLLILMALVPRELSLPTPDVTEIEILPPPAEKSPQKEQQIVRQALVPDQLKTPEDESLARFLSEQRQRVKQETQSANRGMTQNSQPGQETTQKDSNKPTGDNNSKRDLAKEGYETWNPGLPPARRGQGPSATGESLPQDVSIGSFTALNTDRFTYYTFYARIEEMIRFRWESRVQSTIQSADRATLIKIGERAWVTSAEFLLNPKGQLVKALVMKESGIRGFDAAAIGAFREANIFPNPPQELIEEDGYIHLKYNFTVSYRPPIVQ